MKKSLIALAVLAVSGMASAQSTVTLYGLLDTYVAATKSGGLKQTKIESGGLNGSRFGFKGSEDLGGGLKANFLLESGIKVDSGSLNTAATDPFTGKSATNTLFSRQSYVGLSGGFGEIKVGKVWTAYDDVQGSGAALWNASSFAPATNVWRSNNYESNPGNTIYYASPDFGGVTAAASFSVGENKSATVKAGGVGSMNVAYNGGPVSVAFSYQIDKINTASVPTSKVKYTQLNGSYDLGVAKLLAAYGNVKTEGLAPETTKEFQFGVDLPVSSALSLSAGYARSKDDMANDKRTGFGLGGLYTLSKRTNLYMGFQSAKTSPAVGASTKDSIYAAGVRHSF